METVTYKQNQIIIFDTTLRDGEQSPGASMTKEEKIRIARQLEKLGVNVIEAGFAAASPGDFEAISEIAKIVKIPQFVHWRVRVRMMCVVRVKRLNMQLLAGFIRLLPPAKSIWKTNCA